MLLKVWSPTGHGLGVLALNTNVLSYGDLIFIKNIADRIKRYDQPTPAQCKKLIKVVEKAEDKGYIMPDK